MDLEDAGPSIRYLIRDRGGKFCALFDEVLADAGIQVVLTGVRMPRMNAVMERWVGACRRELLDRILIWNQAHLLHALREFESARWGMAGMPLEAPARQGRAFAEVAQLPPLASARKQEADLVSDVLHDLLDAQGDVHAHRHAEEHHGGHDVRQRHGVAL